MNSAEAVAWSPMCIQFGCSQGVASLDARICGKIPKLRHGNRAVGFPMNEVGERSVIDRKCLREIDLKGVEAIDKSKEPV